MSRADPAAGATRRPRILVIRRRYLGDLILLEPFLRNLRTAHPSAWITVVVDQGYGEVLRGCEVIDAIAELPRGRASLRQRWRDWLRLLRTVASRPYDLAFDFARNERAAFTLLLARARRRVSYDISDDVAVRRRKPSDVLRRRLMSTDLIRVSRAEQEALHTVDWNNRLLEPLGLVAHHRVPQLAVAEGERERARALLRRSSSAAYRDGRPRVLVHPGGRGDAKRWPAERFAQVADALATDLDCDVVLTAGPGEEDLLREVVRARTHDTGLVLDPMPLGLLYAVLAECDLFVGNDSGPAHMASAVGTPTCTLFGDASASMWRTLGPNDEVLQTDLPCGDACVRPDACAPASIRYCVRRIGVEEVIATVSRMVARGVRTGRPGAAPASSASSACS